jgi:ferredoxin
VTREEIAEERRTLHGYLVCIDRRICVGFEDCVTGVPGAFRLDGEGIATFDAPESVDATNLLGACASCPVDAIRVLDGDGRQIVP